MNLTRAMSMTHVLLRIVAGYLFFQHGAQKLFGWFGGSGGASAEPVALMTLMGLAAVLEFYGGIAIALGLLTRPVAFLLSGQMAVAYLMAHQPRGAWPIQNHGESAVLFSFIFLFFATQGAGGFSLDALLQRVRGRSGVMLPHTIAIAEPRPVPSPTPL